MQDHPVQQGRPTPPPRPRGGAVLGVWLGLLWVAWVLVPAWLAYGSAIVAAPFFGESPTEAEKADARQLFAWAVVLALALPAVGLVVSLSTHRRVNAAAFACALTVAGVVALGAGALAAQRAPDEVSPPAPYVCQERSGGDNDCPGD